MAARVRHTHTHTANARPLLLSLVTWPSVALSKTFFFVVWFRCCRSESSVFSHGIATSSGALPPQTNSKRSSQIGLAERGRVCSLELVGSRGAGSEGWASKPPLAAPRGTHGHRKKYPKRDRAWLVANEREPHNVTCWVRPFSFTTCWLAEAHLLNAGWCRIIGMHDL